MFADVSSFYDLPSTVFNDHLDFGEARIKQLRSGLESPNQLHHYTDSAGFNGIVTNASFRATHIGYLNDGNEYVKTIATFLNALDAALKDKKYPKECEAMLFELHSQLVSTTPQSFPPLFVICFTKSRNSLNQWRAYSRGDGGFSIGVDTTQINDGVNNGTKTAELLPVIYNDAQLHEFIDDYLSWLFVSYPKHLTMRGEIPEEKFQNDWIGAVRLITSLLGTMFKDEEFKEEAEFRIAILAELNEVKFNPKAKMLSPYIEFSLGPSQNGTLPITEIWAGPGQYTPLNAVAARVLLMQKGYDLDKISINQSAIRYRVG